MRTLLLSTLTFFVIIPLFSFGQEVDYAKRIDSLNKKRSVLLDEIAKIESELKTLNIEKTNLNQRNIKPIPYKTHIKSNIKNEQSPLADILCEIKKGEVIVLYSYNTETQYFIASFNECKGYINEVFVQENEEIKELKRIAFLDKEKKDSNLENENKLQFKKILISKYGIETTKDLLAGKYWIGMTDDMAISSLGHPEHRNETVGTYGKHEQWVYTSKKLYLYFENKILKSYQTER